VRNSYKKAFRLKRQKDIANLVRNGKRFDCNIFIASYEKNDLAYDRFNVLVSRKNGGAVERVRIKRIYREAYINTNVEDEFNFYDILLRPSKNHKHEFGEVLKIYGRWRNVIIKNNSGERDLLPDTVR
jgi:ribonuclease P protein component